MPPRKSLALLLTGAVLAILGASSCDRASATKGAPASSASVVASAAPSAAPLSANSTPDAGSDAASSAAPPAKTAGCPDGMVRVSGEYCPVVIQNCREYHPEYEKNKDDKNVSSRCLHYDEPSRCFVKERVKLDFCMDRYEWPNRVGEIPRILTSWGQAKEFCKGVGKRLCTEDEFNFACEGPEMLPYVNGFDRDGEKCNIDKPYQRPDHTRRMLHYDECLKDDWCRAEVARLDQRHEIGSTHTCVSWAGVIDMNGNVNEWVELPGKKFPDRSGLKGGWWGPVRNRCRPTVTFHKEEDYGYEAGFRCCHDAKG